MKFRKKPVVIDAIQWDGIEETISSIMEINKLGRDIGFCPPDGTLDINTLEGVHKANIGDFIIQGVNGEIYPCKPDIFEKTYEQVFPDEENVGKFLGVSDIK